MGFINPEVELEAILKDIKLLEQEKIKKISQIEAVQKDIASLEKEIDSKKIIFNFLDSKRQEKPNNPSKDENIETQKPIMTDEVRKLINDNRFSDRGFTTTDVINALTILNLIPQGVDLRKSVSGILVKLNKKGEIERTYVGKGNIPHVYKKLKDSRHNWGNGEVADATTSATLFN